MIPRNPPTRRWHARHGLVPCATRPWPTARSRTSHQPRCQPLPQTAAAC
jgi:hypothetical protein